MKGASHALYLPGVLEGAEGRVKLKSTGLGVAKELALECQPGLARGGAVSTDVVLEI